jgi:EAL domain-containing protein (putative c-di-GMP-specific phosphodiesterase class I)
MLETFAGLRLHGFGLILNQFGSGESSLASLDTLPLTAIKIDPRYTADIISNSMHRKLLKSMLDLGRQLDVKVVATGVEGRYQRQYLSGIGFQLLQGDFIGKPVSVKEIVRRHGRVSSEICQAC